MTRPTAVLLSAAFLALATLPAAAASPAVPAGGDLIDRILIVINDEIVTATEVDQRVASVRFRLETQNIAVPPDPVLRRQVIEHMIVERLQVQLGRTAGLKVTEEQINRAIRSIAEREGKTVESIQAQTNQLPGGYKQFRRELRDQILARQVVEHEVTNRVTVTESEIDEFLAARKARGAIIEYNLSHILITVPESASPEKITAARQHAEQIHQRITGGADFSEMAIAHSQGQNALEGGGLGWRADGQLPDLFVEALRKMEPGQISTVLRSPNGFHILRLNDRRGDQSAFRVTQTHARHILIKPNELQSAADVRQKLRQLRERLVIGEAFDAAAKSNSDDIGSAANGGDLGWVNPGQTVPEFEKVMNALKPGEISEPVTTRFGIHLIQVLERRDQDLTSERERGQAREQILARKTEQRIDMWLRQLRDEAFIEYRSDPAAAPATGKR